MWVGAGCKPEEYRAPSMILIEARNFRILDVFFEGENGENCMDNDTNCRCWYSGNLKNYTSDEIKRFAREALEERRKAS